MLFAVILLTVLFLALAWPKLMVWSLQERVAVVLSGADPDAGKRGPPRLVDNPASYLIAVGFVLSLVVYLALLVLGQGAKEPKTLWDIEPVAGVLGAVFGTAFGYARLFPSPVYVGFLRVLDAQTGAVNEKRRRRLDVTQDGWGMVVVVIHNMGIRTWGSYRVSVEVDGPFKGRETSQAIPWASSEEMRFQHTGVGLRVQERRGDDPLPVGGSYQARFMLDCDAVQPGTYPVRVSVTTSGGIAASQRNLCLRVWPKGSLRDGGCNRG